MYGHNHGTNVMFQYRKIARKNTLRVGHARRIEYHGWGDNRSGLALDGTFHNHFTSMSNQSLVNNYVRGQLTM